MRADIYDWAGGREAMLRFGPGSGPVVIAAMPLFEEANRTRAFMAAILRALGERGVAGALPDLPGTGDSLRTTDACGFGDWRDAFAAAAATLRAGHPSVHVIAIRGGALVDGAAKVASRWHFAPVAGANLLRDMLRTRLAAAKEEGAAVDESIGPPGPPVELGGNRLSRALLSDLMAATPAVAMSLRVVRLETDAAPADRKVAAAPLWRRAEPGNDHDLADLLAADIAAWIERC